MRVSQQVFINAVNNIKGCSAVSLDIITTPAMRKTDNPFMGAVKSVTLNGLIGFIYEHSCENEMVREGVKGEFQAKERKWGTLLDGGYFVEHKGKYYLQVKVQSASTPVYNYHGAVIPTELIKPFLPERKQSSSQVEAGIEKEVIIRDIQLENIKAIRMLGEEWIIAEAVEQEKELVTELVPA